MTYSTLPIILRRGATGAHITRRHVALAPSGRGVWLLEALDARGNEAHVDLALRLDGQVALLAEFHGY